MSLEAYKKKRDFKKTPEPPGKKKNRSHQLIFVVQRHKATSLHYDFRLEMEGVLKSWAVPKGPSLNPKDKRLAMMVEDHPLDYASFEGIIPENHYGAGIVEIWDEGTYEDISENDAAKAEKKLLSDLQQGSLKFVLHGKKLKGEFALVKMKSDVKGNAWLLIKHNDAYAVKDSYNSETQTPPSSPINKFLREKRPTAKKKVTTRVDTDPKKAFSRKNIATSGKKYTDYIKPMLAKAADKVFSDPGWLYEIKWDGYRAIAEVGEQTVKLYSRNGLSFAEKYKPVAEALAAFSEPAVLDGEIVALDENGRPGFQLLQDYANGIPDNELYYYVFDLLFYQGEDIRKKPLSERKALLKKLLKKDGTVRYCDHIQEDGEGFFRLAKEKNLEGIIAKKADSQYVSGKRTDNWLKMKNHHTTEAVIAGFTQPRGSRRFFGALILGMYKNGELQYVGHTGTGFTEKTLKDLAAEMKPFIRKKSPFKDHVPVNSPATWVKPVLICNVKYTERTKDGILRHPVFQGLRVDKAAKEVQWEESARSGLSVTGRQHTSQKKAISNHKKDVPGRNDKDKTINISGHKLSLTNLDKIFWPDEGITKGDVIAYYDMVSKFILPYLKNRPESLKRNPNGIADKGFYHKDAGDGAPEWVDTRKIFSESTKEDVDYIICNHKATLLYLANLGCIEINPWNSRTSSLEQPDYFIIDIDPSEKNTYDEVIDVALAVKKILDKAVCPAYCKTSGATGMHVYIPLGAKYTYDQARSFAELIAHLVQQQVPAISTLERSLQKREKNKIYIDYLQNSRGQTLASAYSLRPRPGATVSTPLKWAEVKHGLRPGDFNIHTVPKRLEKTGDLFREVLKKGIDLRKCIKALEK